MPGLVNDNKVPSDLGYLIFNLLKAQGAEKSAKAILKELELDEKEASSNNSAKLLDIFNEWKNTQ